MRTFKGHSFVFCWTRVAQPLVFCIMFCESLFVIFHFCFGHCFVCLSSIHDYLLPLLYLQTYFKLDTIQEVIITVIGEITSKNRYVKLDNCFDNRTGATSGAGTGH